MNRRWLKFGVALTVLSLVGCSSQQKARREQRDKVVQTAKLYCEYINGEQFQDIDVALNLAMAQRCDGDKPFSVSQYKTPSDVQGMMYCCGMKHQADVKKASSPADKPSDKPADKSGGEGEKIEENL